MKDDTYDILKNIGKNNCKSERIETMNKLACRDSMEKICYFIVACTYIHVYNVLDVI